MRNALGLVVSTVGGMVGALTGNWPGCAVAGFSVLLCGFLYLGDELKRRP